MPAPLVTLTTDFGEGSPYVAALKGVLLSTNPDTCVLDLSHGIPPQDLRHAAFFLAAALPWFPPEVLHVVVVDPGVGSARAILYVEAAGQRLLVPDNGCWTPLAAGGPAPRVLRLAEPRYWRPQVSRTFHGRDVFAPVAGHLSRGLDPGLLGPAVSDWVRLDLPAPAPVAGGWRGEIVFVDHFGNLLTNVLADRLPGPPVRLRLGPHDLGPNAFRRVRAYAEAEPGSLVVLTSSMGTLEVAVTQGSAARRLNVTAGTPVLVGCGE